jgi:hypothetical protein
MPAEHGHQFGVLTCVALPEAGHVFWQSESTTYTYTECYSSIQWRRSLLSGPKTWTVVAKSG